MNTGDILKGMLTSAINALRYDATGKRIVGGVDWLARQWAEAHGIECMTIEADWRTHGKAAGPIRNRKQAEEGDALVAIPEGRSKGTRGMIAAMEALKKPVFVKELSHTVLTLPLADDTPELVRAWTDYDGY